MEETAAATCRRTIEFTIPILEVEAETDRAVADLRKKVKLPGFRPGKAPEGVIRSRFKGEIEDEVVNKLVQRAFGDRAHKDQINVVGSPAVKKVHFHKGEPLEFSVEFEVEPQFELGEYIGLECPYEEPRVTDEAISERLNLLRERKVEYVNIDPRPAVTGDVVVVSMRSVAGVDGEPVQNEDMQIELGNADTMPEFNEAFAGMSPDEEKEVTVKYPSEYGHAKLAGREVTFHCKVKGLRKKELPELNDEFAQDMGDFKTVLELTEEVRRQLLREREFALQQAGKNHLVDTLVNTHDFPVPEVWVDRQVRMLMESQIRELAGSGIDVKSLNIDWKSLGEHRRPQAVRDVRASLILGKIAEREALAPMQDEVDRELQRIARAMREPVAAVRMRAEKDGTLENIANRIVTDKVLNLLFEKSRKVAPESIAPKTLPAGDSPAAPTAEAQS